MSSTIDDKHRHRTAHRIGLSRALALPTGINQGILAKLFPPLFAARTGLAEFGDQNIEKRAGPGSGRGKYHQWIRSSVESNILWMVQGANW